MRTLDRYLLGVMLPAVGVFCVAFTAIFLAVDAADKLRRFLELQTLEILPFAVRYYACRLPISLTYLLPSVVLFAPLFTIVKLSRSNEIVPVAVVGISLRRLCAPFLATALATSVLIAVMEEYVLVPLVEEIEETGDILNSRQVNYGVLARDRRSLLFARAYNSISREMRDLRITWQDDDAVPVRTVRARHCRWNGQRRRWIAVDGTDEHPETLEFPPGAKPRPRKDPLPPEGLELDTALGPEDLRSTASTEEMLSSASLREVLRDARENPEDPRRWMKVHARFSFLLTPVILLLIGLPPAVTAQSRSLTKGLVGGAVLVTLYYGLYFIAQDFGTRGHLPPLLAGWGPTALFAVAGAVSWSRMRT
jgi:lipopolysaccharide export LptBFGC system permease protein LptF